MIFILCAVLLAVFLLTVIVHTRKGFVESLLRLPRYYKSEKAANEKAMELLDFMGLADVADAMVDAVAIVVKVVTAMATVDVKINHE